MKGFGWRGWDGVVTYKTANDGRDRPCLEARYPPVDGPDGHQTGENTDKGPKDDGDVARVAMGSAVAVAAVAAPVPEEVGDGMREAGQHRRRHHRVQVPVNVDVPF